MKKTIYNGVQNGLYKTASNFGNFLRELNAEHIVEKAGFLGCGFVYYIDAYNIALHGTFNDSKNTAEIDLFGYEKDISRFEKIIQEEEKKYSGVLK